MPEKEKISNITNTDAGPPRRTTGTHSAETRVPRQDPLPQDNRADMEARTGYEEKITAAQYNPLAWSERKHTQCRGSINETSQNEGKESNKQNQYAPIALSTPISSHPSSNSIVELTCFQPSSFSFSSSSFSHFSSSFVDT